MIRRLQTLIWAGTDPYENLALEECLRRRVEEGTCILYLWQNRPTVVIGRNQNPWQECRSGALRSDGVLLARRPSGGGAVYHDLGNQNFSFLVNEADYSVKKQLSVVVEACRSLGIPAEISGRNDVLAEGRKFSGNAFLTHQGRCCHHGTLLVDADLEALGRYLSPSPAKLRAKGVASVRSRVVNLCQLREGLGVEQIRKSMVEAFQAVYGLEAEALDARSLPWGEIGDLAERNRSWEWLWGRQLPCTLQWAERFGWGELTIQLEAEGGVVRRAAVYTDAMDWTLSSALEGALTGCRLSGSDLARVVADLDLAAEVKADVLSLLEGQEI